MKTRPLYIKALQFYQDLVTAHGIFLVILFLAAVVRFYRLPEMAAYDNDQEFVSNFVFDVVYEYPIRYIGQGLSIKGLFLGPWYFYYLVPFYGLADWQPLGGLVGSVVLGIITVTTYYAVGWKLFSKEVGLLAALLRGFTFFAINVDWMMVPAHQSDLVVIIFWYLLYELWKKKWWALPSLALVGGLFTSFHPIQVPLWGVLLILILIWKVKAKWWLWLTSFGLFILPSLPLIMFEYWRKGAMLKRLIELLTEGSGVGFHPIQIWVKTNIVIDFFEELLSIPANLFWLGLLMFIAFICLLAWMIKQKRVISAEFHQASLMAIFPVVVLFYAVFPGNVPEYYLGSLRALLYLYLPMVLVFLYHRSKYWRVGVISLVGYILVVNLQTLINRYQHPELLSTYYHKQAVINHILSRVGDKEFALSLITQPGWEFGFDSLLRLKHHRSAGKGPVYTIIAPRTQFADNEYDVISGNLGLTYPDDQ